VSGADKAALLRIDAETGYARGASTAEFAAKAVAWLRRMHHYTLAPKIPGGRGDPLVRWTASSEPGHCELFAGALVLLARSAGIPARVVTGFKGGTWNAYSGNYTVRNSDAHAWAEIWDPASGSWLREDPLAAAAAVDPSKEKGDAAIAGMLDRSWSARFNSLRVFWYRRIVNFDQQSQADTLKAVKSATDNSGKWIRSLAAGFAPRVRSWLARPWNAWRVLRLSSFAAAAGAVVWLLATGRWRLSAAGRGLRTDPVRREAGRWLARVSGPESLVADLQRLRYGPAPTWPKPPEVFRNARKAESRSRRRRRAASQKIS
jgi:hypothetical protein